MMNTKTPLQNKKLIVWNATTKFQQKNRLTTLCKKPLTQGLFALTLPPTTDNNT